MNLAQLYDTLTAAGNLSGWQEMYVNFYKAWFLNDRWIQYFKGLLTTIEVTIIALIIGVVLGMVVAVIRTAHDQQRLGRRNPVLGVVNALCKIYVTVIRGTPMMVQLLIMGFVIFKSSRNFYHGGRPVPGHQLRRLCGGDHPGRPHVPGPRPDGGRPVPGPWVSGHHALHRHPPGLQGHPPLSGQRIYHACSRTPPSFLSSAERKLSTSPRPSLPRPMRPCTPTSSSPLCTLSWC